MQLQPKLVTLYQLLNERLFRIPEYQRAYSWGSKQRADLFEDIKKAAASNEPHFMATVVGLRRGTKTIITTKFQEIEIVDGQQRITTLVILLKAIERALDPEHPTERAVASELQKLLVKQDELCPVLLQTNHDSSHYCLNYLRWGKRHEPEEAKTIADRRLLDAMAECERFVQHWRNSRDLVSLVTVLHNELTFIFHEIDNERVVYTVFEVLNSRGLAVPWMDRLKSILMGIAFEAKGKDADELIAELHHLWRDIFACIGLRGGLSAETLKVAGTLWSPEMPSRPLGEEDAVETLRRKGAATNAGVVDVSQWLLRVTHAMAALLADERRGGVTHIGQVRLLGGAILLRDDFTQREREELLELWERVSFRIYGMCGKDARTKVGDYVRLSWRVIQHNLSAKGIAAEIRNIGKEFSIEKAVAELRNANCYSDWQAQLRYLLWQYDEHLAARAGQIFTNVQWGTIWAASAADSIEHIQPQSKGAHEPTETGIYVHRLGNLVLLPPKLNSKLKDKDPKKKAEAYRDTGLQQARQVAKKILQDENWTRDAVIEREEEILAWAKERWGD